MLTNGGFSAISPHFTPRQLNEQLCSVRGIFLFSDLNWCSREERCDDTIELRASLSSQLTA